MSNFPDDFSWKQFERYYGEDKREFTRADVKAFCKAQAEAFKAKLEIAFLQKFGIGYDFLEAEFAQENVEDVIYECCYDVIERNEE